MNHKEPALSQQDRKKNSHDPPSKDVIRYRLAEIVFDGMPVNYFKENTGVEVLVIEMICYPPAGSLSLVDLLGGKQLMSKEDLWCTIRSEEHTSELQSRGHIICRL